MFKKFKNLLKGIVTDTHIPSGLNLPGNMSDVLVSRILSLIAVPENDNISWWKFYDYAEKLFDSDERGITFGIAGFCTAADCGDGLEVLQALYKINKTHKMCKYIAILQKHKNGLTGMESFVKDVKSLGINDQDWNKATWTVYQSEYFNPVMKFAIDNGFKYPLSKYVFLDTTINFGYDGMQNDIVKKLKSKLPKDGGDEVVYMNEFILLKISVLKSHKSYDDGQTDRGVMQMSILESKNYNLNVPMTVKCYGDSFTLKN